MLTFQQTKELHCDKIFANIFAPQMLKIEVLSFVLSLEECANLNSPDTNPWPSLNRHLCVYLLIINEFCILNTYLFI